MLNAKSQNTNFTEPSLDLKKSDCCNASQTAAAVHVLYLIPVQSLTTNEYYLISG